MKKGISRRRVIAGLGAAGIAALGGSRSFAAQERQEPMTTEKLEDPYRIKFGGVRSF